MIIWKEFPECFIRWEVRRVDEPPKENLRRFVWPVRWSIEEVRRTFADIRRIFEEVPPLAEPPRMEPPLTVCDLSASDREDF